MDAEQGTMEVAPAPVPLAAFPTRRYFWALAILFAILLLAPIRRGDLPGYDDARWSVIAKDLAHTHHWLDIRYDGGAAMEHPPLFSWIQAAFFLAFGLSDPVAKLPTALCGLGVILLVYWLVRKLTDDSFVALLAMFVMATTLYFIKYCARAMTDVPFTLFVLAAVCAWILAEEKPVWYLAAGLFTAMALMTREMMGFALPTLFVLDAAATRRRPSARYWAPSLAIAFLPATLWYARWISIYGHQFFDIHSTFLSNEVYGPLSPSWRRYTGAFEYIWMVSKSYWPWLPFMIVGLTIVIRRRDRRFTLIAIWIAVVFALCAVTKSRVLRYMLPAYPAFAACAAIGLVQVVRERYLRSALRILIPILGVVVIGVALFPPVTWHAMEIRPIAAAATAATNPKELISFYDEGQPRIDEMNQMLWYGDRLIVLLFDRNMLTEALREPRSRIFVVDRAAYRDYIDSQIANQVILESGDLICFRLCGAEGSGCEGSPVSKR